jgi:hypothetical protein
MIIRIASGHRIDRSTVATPGGEVRGRKWLRRPDGWAHARRAGEREATREFAGVRMESGAATSEPYYERCAGQD